MSDFESKIIIVDLNADIQKQFDVASDKECRQLAYRYIMDNLKGEYITSDGLVVEVGSRGARELIFKDKVINNIKIKLAPHLDEIIKSATFDNIKNVYKKRKDSFDKFAYYIAKISIDDIVYSATINIGINSKTNKAVFYDINPLSKI